MQRDLQGLRPFRPLIHRVLPGAKMKQMSILTLFVLCVGCSTGHTGYDAGHSGFVWYSPNKTLFEAEQDCRECGHMAAGQSIANKHARHQDRVSSGMDGTHQVSSQEFWFYHEKNNAFIRFMISRGYERVPISKLGQEVQTKRIKINNRNVTIAGK